MNEVDEWVKKNGVTKLPLGYASGATKNGAVCAGSFSASLLSQSQARSNWIKGKEQKKEHLYKKRKKNREKTKKLKNKPASEKQLNYAMSLGLKLSKNISMRKAHNLISQFLRIQREEIRRIGSLGSD